MKINEALKQGYSIQVKTGHMGNQFIKNELTVVVTVGKDGNKGIAYGSFSEKILDEIHSLSKFVLEPLIDEAIDNHERTTI